MEKLFYSLISLLSAFFVVSAFGISAHSSEPNVSSCKTVSPSASYILAFEKSDISLAACLSKSGVVFKNTEEHLETLEQSITYADSEFLKIILDNGAQLNWLGYKTWQAIYFRLSGHLREFSDLSQPLSQIPLEGQNKPAERHADLKKAIPETEKVFSLIFNRASHQVIEQLEYNYMGTKDYKKGSFLYSIASSLCAVDAKKIMDTDKLLNRLIKSAQGKVYFGALDLFNSFTKLRTADGVHEDPVCHEKVAQAFIRKEDWRLITTKEGFEELGKKILGPEKYEKLKKERTKEPNS